MGSMSPLFAIFDACIKFEKLTTGNFFWIGTTNKKERELVQGQDIDFYAIPSGKLRRYFSLKNIIDPFFVLFAFFISCFILFKNRPNIIIATGSFVSVPVAYAAKLLFIPIVIHQLDVQPGLANKLIAPIAKRVTVSFADSLSFYGDKAILVGTMVRDEIRKAAVVDKRKIKAKLNIPDTTAVVLAVGGSSGAQAINEIIKQTHTALEKKYHIFHQTGVGKGNNTASANYTQYEFIEAEYLANLIMIADVVISRAGIGFISELAFLGKPSIIIPMPNSHQEKNAEILEQAEAAIILNQSELKTDVFVKIVDNLIKNTQTRIELTKNIKNICTFEAEQRIIEEIKLITKDELA